MYKRQDVTRASCRFIKSLCVDSLKLRQAVKCTALVYFHRFYARQSLRQHDSFLVATTCVFLAAKVEEQVQAIEVVAEQALALRARLGGKEPAFLANVVVAAAGAGGNGSGADAAAAAATNIQEAKRWAMQEKVKLCERMLLHTLSFNISVEAAHAHAVKQVQKIAPGQEGEELRQVAWSILNDSLDTNTCLRYQQRQIAAAAVLVAGMLLRNRKNLSEAAKSVVEKLHALEKRGEAFGFKMEELRPIQDELLSSYEEAAGGEEAVRALSGDASSSASSDASKRARVAS